MMINWFDWAIVAIMLISVVVSFFRGFFREVLSLVIWVLAFFLALKFSKPLSEHLTHFVNSPMIRYAVAFLLIALGVLLVGMIVSMGIKMVIDKTGLGIFDRLLGIVFGVARGVLVVAVSSTITPRFKPLVLYLDRFMPEQVQELSNWFKQTKQV